MCVYRVRSDGRTGYERLKGRPYGGKIAAFGECLWYRTPDAMRLSSLDERWTTAIWLGKSWKTDEHIIAVGIIFVARHGVVLGRVLGDRGQSWWRLSSAGPTLSHPLLSRTLPPAARALLRRISTHHFQASDRAAHPLRGQRPRRALLFRWRQLFCCTRRPGADTGPAAWKARRLASKVRVSSGRISDRATREVQIT